MQQISQKRTRFTSGENVTPLPQAVVTLDRFTAGSPAHQYEQTSRPDDLRLRHPLSEGAVATEILVLPWLRGMREMSR